MIFRDHIPSELPAAPFVDPYNPRKDRPWPAEYDEFFDTLFNHSPPKVVRPGDVLDAMADERRKSL